MYICERNYTIAVYATYINKYLYAENNKVTGALGEHVQKFIGARRSFPNLCKLVNESKVGQKQANGSYDGAIGLIEKKLVFALIKPETPFVDSNLIEFSPATNSENHLIAHPLYEKSNDPGDEKKYFLNLFDFKFIQYFLIVEIAFFLITLGLICLLKKKQTYNGKKIARSFSFLVEVAFNSEKFTKISLISSIVLFLIIFEFLIKQILSINVKTSKVVVDHSQVITDEEKLFKSPYFAGWLEDEREFNFAKTAPKDTFMNKIYKYKNRDPPIMVSKSDFVKEMDQFHKGIFLMMNSLVCYISTNYLSIFMKLNFFINQKPFYSIYNVWYRVKEKSPRVAYADKSILTGTEGGFFEKMIYDLKRTKLLDDPNHKKIYTSLEEYIDDNTFFESIKLGNFYYLFFAYFGFNFCLLSIFVFHRVFVWTLNHFGLFGRESNSIEQRMFTKVEQIYVKAKK